MIAPTIEQRQYRKESMPGNQGLDRITELTAWLGKDDATSREMRAVRLHDLVDILPIPSNGISVLGGEESSICFDEIRRCYMHGPYTARPRSSDNRAVLRISRISFSQQQFRVQHQKNEKKYSMPT